MNWKLLIGLAMVAIAAYPSKSFDHDSQSWAIHHALDVLVAAFWGFWIRSKAKA